MKKVLLLNALLLAALANPAMAASKSNTVSVSCTVPPMIQIASATASMRSAEVSTSLDKRYQMTEHDGIRNGQRVRVCSLTAL